MNDVTATSRGLDPVAKAREIGRFIAEAADQIERDQQIPAPLLAKIIEARLPRMLLPRSAGGNEVEPWIYLRAIEEISRRTPRHHQLARCLGINCTPVGTGIHRGSCCPRQRESMEDPAQAPSWNGRGDQVPRGKSNVGGPPRPTGRRVR